MRKILALAVILAALGMASQTAGAHDRTFSFGRFSPHATPRLHVPQRGLMFHHRGFVGQPRHFKPRQFGHFGHNGFVLRFGDGGSMFKFGHVPQFKPDRFGVGQSRGGLILRFGHPQDFALRRHPGFAFDKFRQVAPGHFRVLDPSLPDLEEDRDAVLERAAPPEVSLERRLEELGFRDVQGLLREFHLPRFGMDQPDLQ